MSGSEHIWLASDDPVAMVDLLDEALSNTLLHNWAAAAIGCKTTDLYEVIGVRHCQSDPDRIVFRVKWANAHGDTDDTGVYGLKNAADLLRCVVGNPFRPVTLTDLQGERPANCGVMEKDLECAGCSRRLYGQLFPCPMRPKPDWLTPKVEEAALAFRKNEDGESLAYVLERVGCPDTAILYHLRKPGPHCSSCWVARLLLGED